MITGDPAIPIKQIEHYFRELVSILPNSPVIKKAALGDFGGLYGALSYIGEQKH
jgi:hypothetical protein